MKNNPKNMWEKSRPASRWFRAWLVLLMATFLIVFVVGLMSNWPRYSSEWLPAIFFAAILSIVIATVVLGLWAFLRWLFCWRNFMRFLLGAACFAAVVALFYAEEDWRGKHDWETFKRRWEAKGERFDRASVVPPPVPDDQNFAMAPVFDAVDKMMNQKWLTEHKNPHYGQGGDWNSLDTNIVDPLDMNVTYNYEPPPTNGIGNWQTARMSDLESWQHYYRALAAKTNLFPVAPQPQTPAQDVLLALGKYDSTIGTLREASQRLYSRFPLDYDDENPAEILLPHLADLKRCAQVLQLRALAELQNSQNDKALADVKLMLYLANSIRTEPILISHLVRIAIVTLTLQPIYGGLAEHKWSDAQLVELNSELAKLDLLSGYQTAMRGEMVLCPGGIFDYLRRHPERLPGLFAMSDDGDSASPIVPRIVAWLIPRGWFYQNQLHSARPMVEFYLPAVDVNQHMVYPEKLRRADAVIEASAEHLTPFNVIERLLVPALSKAATRFASGQESVDLARVACALERYHIAHGEFPESLDAFAPQFIAKLPHDVINGQPLHYRRTTDGEFVLYSVGWNETDDGGVVGLTQGGSVDINKGDWVWRYPVRAK